MKEKDFDFNEGNIDLIELLGSFWSHKFIIITLVVAFMAAFGIKTVYFTKDTYSASGALYVSSRTVNNGETIKVNKSEIEAARTLSETYTETLRLRSFLMDVSDSVNNKYSWQQIKKMLTISTINDTELISVSVTADSAYDAYIITKKITELATGKLAEVSDGGKITVIDEVQMPTAPNNRNTVKKVLIGGAIGLFIGMAVVFLISQLDKKIHNISDVENRYNLSILGELSK